MVTVFAFVENVNDMQTGLDTRNSSEYREKKIRFICNPVLPFPEARCFLL